MRYDVIIKNGTYFDGSGADGAVRHIGVRDGRVATVSETPLDESGCPRVFDAAGRWVTPGFIEPHSHYDAEIIASPKLDESVRHGVTTVMTGICSISMVCAEAEDCSDLFTRVEAVPREEVLPLLKQRKTWRSPTEFRSFIEAQPLATADGGLHSREPRWLNVTSRGRTVGVGTVDQIGHPRRSTGMRAAQLRWTCQAAARGAKQITLSSVELFMLTPPSR